MPVSGRTRRSSDSFWVEAFGLWPRSVKPSVPSAVADWAVATVNVAFAEPPAGTATLTGAAEAPNGSPVAVRLTVPAKPFVALHLDGVRGRVAPVHVCLVDRARRG